jgi:hypothetical protein
MGRTARTPKTPARIAWEKAYDRSPKRRASRSAQMFLRNHGITREQADAMAEAQGGVCKVCGCPPTGKGHCSRLHLDHDHATGEHRSMLCVGCNTALGLMKDNPETLRAAADYLEAHART